MGRYYGEEQSCFPVKPPRPDPEPIMSDDTGNAAKDGFTVLKRRPFGTIEADMVDPMAPDEASQMEENSGDYPMGFGPFSW